MRFHILVFLVIAIGWASGFPAASAERFSSVRDYLDESVQDGVVAGGSVIVFQEGEIVFQTGFGYADIRSKVPFRVDTPVVIASISKPLLGTILYRLAESDELDLAIPISEYLPEFSDRKLESGDLVKRAPSVKELLTHTSGLRASGAPGGRIWFQEWTQGKTLEYVVKKVAHDIPFKSQPGTAYAYSGIGTDVAARVGELASGLPRNEMLQTYLCTPLAMPTTFYRAADGLNKLGRPMPTRYYRSKDTGKLVESRKRPVPEMNRYASSGGSIISTGPDLLNWLLMIHNNGVYDGEPFLEPVSVAAMLQPHALGDKAAGGLSVRSRDESGRPVVYGHGGSSGTNVWIDFKNGVIGIVLTQTKGSDIKPFRAELEHLISLAVLLPR